MQVSWPQCYKWVRLDEGGNDDDPDDDGGRTSRGITQREFNAWCQLHHYPIEDVWKAEDFKIEQIYRGEYWQPYCDLLPVGADYLHFDMHVNAGLVEATKLLQRAAGVRDDGRIGPLTKLALASADPEKLIERFDREKRLFYTGLAVRNQHDRKYLKGWLARTTRVTERSKTLLTLKPPEIHDNAPIA